VYHLFLGPENLREYPELEDYFKRNFLNDKKRLLALVKKRGQNLYYLFNELSMIDLRNQIENDRDEIKIMVHGDGFPFIIGFNQLSPFDLTAVSFARLLSNYLPINREIKIDLLACNSATSCRDSGREFNFAKNTSMVFESLGFTHVEVTGYTGYVVEKPNAKFSVSSEYSVFSDGKKGNHASLKDAGRSYQGGVVKAEALRELLNWDEVKNEKDNKVERSPHVKNWMLPYMNQAQNHLISFFLPPAQNLEVAPPAAALPANPGG